MKLRNATISDVDYYFELVNSVAVRKNSINKNKILLSDHKTWFYDKIQNEDSFLYVLEDDRLNIGQIRFDRHYDYYEIDYSITAEFKGKGYGYQLLLKGIFEVLTDQTAEVKFVGKVLESNISSCKIFERIGFVRTDKELTGDNEVLVKYELFDVPKTNIILSNKKWHFNMLNCLKHSFNNVNWLFCDDKSEFVKRRLDVVKPIKIYIPHWSFIIPKDIFLNYECIVFHMTDLPFGRGGSPLQNLIKRKINRTVISALQVVKELDAGPVYLKNELMLYGTAQEIFLRASSIIKTMICEIEKEGSIPIEQKGEVIKFDRRTPEMSNIEGIDSCTDLYDHIRMLDADGYPKAFFENEGFRFEFSRASIKSNKIIIADVRIIKK